MIGLVRDVLRTLLALGALVLLTLVLAPSALVTARRNPASPLIERMARLWAGGFLRAAGVGYQVEGAELVEPGRPYVVVSNHLSNLDPMLHFVSVPVPIRFLAKQELFGIPVFGPALRAIGIVETDRRGGRAAHAAINRQVEEAVFGHGRSLMVYPEGTRSRDGRMGRFKKGAFHLAVRFGVPVLPCAISGTREAWGPGEKLIRGGRARVRFFSPIATEGLKLADVERLRAEAEQLVGSAYRQLKATDRPG